MRSVAFRLAWGLGAAMAAPVQAVPQAAAQADAAPPAASAPMEPRAGSAWSIAGNAIQPPGPFHAGETVARDGERWLALHVEADKAALLPAVMRVSVIADPLLDEPGERTGEAVRSQLPDEGIRMFLRGPVLVAGQVEQASTQMAGGDGRHRIDQLLTFRDARYSLRSDCMPSDGPPVATQSLFDCRIVLRGPRGREQALVRMDGYADAPGEHARLGNDATPALLFAGDLDRDGELDLLLDTTDHYNLSQPTLFLSSQAGPGELLRAVARHEATGC